MTSRDILIDQLGGNENSYKILIKTYCNHIRDNEDLEPFFGDYDEERLYRLQEMFLKAAFTPDEGPGGKLHRRVKSHHRQLFEKGLDDTHFHSLKEHFLDALNDYCLEDDVYEKCSNELDSLRYMFEENYRRRRSRGGGRFRRTSLGHGPDGEEEEEEPSIAGIPRRCTSLPPVKKGRSKRDPQNAGSTGKSKRGMLKATRSGGDKLKTMLHASKHSDSKEGPERGIRRHNSGDIIKTMLSSATAKLHSNHNETDGGLKRSGSAEKLGHKSTLKRQGSAEKLRGILHLGRSDSKDSEDAAVKRHNSGDMIKNMFNASLRRRSHSRDDEAEGGGMKRSSSGDKLRALLKNSNGGDRVKNLLNGSSSHSRSGHSRDRLDSADIERTTSGNRFNAILNSSIPQS